MLLLFIILKCTIFKCPLSNLHENDLDLLWLLLFFLSVYVIFSKTKTTKKNPCLSKRDHRQSGLSVCFFISFWSFCFHFTMGAGSCEITEITQLYCHMTIPPNLVETVKNIYIFLLPGRAEGGWTDLWIHTTLEEKRHHSFRSHLQSHTTV